MGSDTAPPCEAAGEMDVLVSCIKLTGPFARTITQSGKLRVNFAQVWTGSSIDFDGGAYLCIPQSGAAKFVSPRACGTGDDAGAGGRGDGGGRG